MQTKQDGRLGTEKIGKLMLELALPSVLAQIAVLLLPPSHSDRKTGTAQKKFLEAPLPCCSFSPCV